LTRLVLPNTLFTPMPNSAVETWVPLLRDTLVRDGKFFWQVQGKSMLPTLPPDCTIEIHPVTSKPRRGELLVFADKGTLVVHRLVAKRLSKFILQGDNRAVWDPPISPEQVVGRVFQATYQDTLVYPHKFNRLIAYFWIARYYWLKLIRFLIRNIRKTQA
jgi:phage repressor protein C with HTH and peptisase S24 domain